MSHPALSRSYRVKAALYAWVITGVLAAATYGATQLVGTGGITGVLGWPLSFVSALATFTALRASIKTTVYINTMGRIAGMLETVNADPAPQAQTPSKFDPDTPHAGPDPLETLRQSLLEAKRQEETNETKTLSAKARHPPPGHTLTYSEQDRSDLQEIDSLEHEGIISHGEAKEMRKRIASRARGELSAAPSEFPPSVEESPQDLAARSLFGSPALSVAPDSARPHAVARRQLSLAERERVLVKLRDAEASSVPLSTADRALIERARQDAQAGNLQRQDVAALAKLFRDRGVA